MWRAGRGLDDPFGEEAHVKAEAMAHRQPIDGERLHAARMADLGAEQCPDCHHWIMHPAIDMPDGKHLACTAAVDPKETRSHDTPDSTEGGTS